MLAALTSSVAVAQAARDPGCLPIVGRTTTLQRPVEAHVGVVVRVFGAGTHDAEFRGCDDLAATCELRLHRRRDGRPMPLGQRGFGALVVLPRDALFDYIEPPDCARPQPRREEVKRERPPMRRAPTPTAPVAPPIEAAAVPVDPTLARIAAAPPPQQLLAELGDGALSGGVGEAPPLVALPEPGLRVGLTPRVAVEVDEAGQVTFHDAVELRGPGQMEPHRRYRVAGVGPFDLAWSGQYGEPDALDPASASEREARDGASAGLGVGGTAEGLNALDGVDIDAPAKRAYMAATRPARLARAEAHRRRATLLSLGHLHGRLRALEADETLSTEEKAAKLREMLDDATDPEAGARARALIRELANRL